MGEFSKTIGEKGEKIVDEILNLLGWKSTPINESMPCNLPDKHKSPNAVKGKSTHGSDSFYIYKSPFFTGQLDHIVISSKYTDETYPKSGTSLFKSHFNDLSFTVECYEKSSLRHENNEHFDDIDGEKISGLLFWLSNQESQFGISIFDDLSPDLDNSLVYETNYIVDSCRASYLYECIRSARSIYVGYKFEYYYIDTGNNPSDNSKRYYGKELPIQLIVSDIQVFRLKKEREVIVALFMKDNFSTDNLSRVLGLAHSIAKGLVTKINIHFPDYQSEVHDNTVYRIKRGFQGSSVVDDINVVSYSNAFTVLGNQDHSQNLTSPDDRTFEKLKHNQILPFGNELRDLLSRSQITTHELKVLLRTKGVYVSESKKENLIPILSSILLSPKEFDYLKDKQKVREDSTKRSSSPPLKCSDKVSQNGLVNIIDTINLKEITDKSFCNYQFHHNTLSFAPINGDRNHVEATYKITKTVNNKIWFENKNEFTGSIRLKLGDNGIEITPISNFTSSETEFINNCIKKKVISDLKHDGFISHETKEKKILMSEMTNEEIIHFLLSFTSHRSEVSFVEIISLDIEIDKKVPLPKSNKIKWMEDKVDRFQFDGKKIEELELITEPENHKYLKVWEMLCEFELDSQIGKATFRVKFFFQKSSKHEFSFSVDKIVFTKERSSKKKAEAFILDKIDALKLETYCSLILDTKKPAQGELF